VTTEIDPHIARALDSLAPAPAQDQLPSFEHLVQHTPAGDARKAREVRRLKIALPMAAALAAVIATAPALGINIPFLDFSSAPSAPDRIVRNFDDLDKGAPEGMASGVVGSETREVGTFKLSDGAHTLWVAPTRSGGMCAEWSNAFGGCDALGIVPLDVTYSGGGLRGQHNTIGGNVNLAWADTVEVRLDDGTTLTPALTYVSKPINRGFFLIDVPAERSIESVVARDSRGALVASSYPSTVAAPVPAPEAQVERKVSIASLSMAQGAAVIWQAPTAYGGTCTWLTFEDKSYDLGSCVPKIYQRQSQFWLRTVQTEDAVLVAGRVNQERFRAVTLAFADGARLAVRLSDGFVLAAVSADHLREGYQLTEVVAIARATGERDMHVSIPTVGCGSGMIDPSGACRY
jgi:hypothetical protein